MVKQEENTCVVLDDDISSSLLGHFQENVTPPADEDEFDYDGDDEGQDFCDFWPLNDDEGQDFWPLSTFCVACVMVILFIILVYGTIFLFLFVI